LYAYYPAIFAPHHTHPFPFSILGACPDIDLKEEMPSVKEPANV
jgi:hypothetical protein